MFNRKLKKENELLKEKIAYEEKQNKLLMGINTELIELIHFKISNSPDSDINRKLKLHLEKSFVITTGRYLRDGN